MLKVCMLVHQDYYYDARVQRYAEALADAGAEIDVLALRGVAPTPTRVDRRIHVYTIPLRRAYQRHQSYLQEYAVACVLFTLWLLPLFLRRRHQIIHVHNMPDFLIFTALLPRLLGARLILDIHDPMPEVYISKYDAPPESRAVWLMRLQERWSARAAHAVITANANFRTTLIQRGVPAKKITVVNNLADPRIFDRARYPTPPARSDGRFTLFYPGTLAPRYGLEIALRALPELIPHIPNITLRLMGAHSEHAAALAQLAQQLGVAAWVEFRPAVPLHEVPAEMLRADIGIYPAYADAHMRVATPSKVLEFVAMGLPVVAARLPVLTSLFSGAAVSYFEPGDLPGFVRAVRELHADPARRRALAQAADRESAARPTWDAEAAHYLGMLRGLLGEEASHVRA